MKPEDAFDTSVKWSSSNNSIATVDGNGTIKGKSSGTAIITATAEDGSGVSASCSVTVIVNVSRISLNHETYKLLKGDKFTLKASVTPKSASDSSVSWSSSNKAIATVDANGVVTAVKGGTATITATANDGSGVSDNCKVVVVAPVDKIILNKYNIDMSVGEQFQLTATVKPDTAADKSVKWSSSSSSYARVDQSGKVVAKSGGIVYIVATAMDGSNVSASCEVIINYPRTGWIANIDYTATVNVRKTPSPRGEVSTTAGYGRVLTVTAPAMDGWYPVLLSDGTRGYISSQFVVWEKPYDPPKMTTTTKKYIHISKSGYPRNGWAGNKLAQTSKLNLKSQPKSSSSTLRKAPYGTKGVVKGYTSNGYYVGGGGNYQITYAYGNHVQFKKPGINYSALSASDREIVTKSNSGNCGSCGGTGGGTGGANVNNDDIPDDIYVGTQTVTSDPANVEKKYIVITSQNGVKVRKGPSESYEEVVPGKGAGFREQVEYLGSEYDSAEKKDSNGNIFVWFKIRTLPGSKLDGKEGYIRSDLCKESSSTAESVQSSTQERKDYIWSFLKNNLSEASDYHIAAIMGNMSVETWGTFSPTKLEGYSDSFDETWYIEQYDIYDRKGWGLLQWTFYTRKQGLYNKAQEMNSNVGNIDVQLMYFIHEIRNVPPYNSRFGDFIRTTNINDATKFFCEKIEEMTIGKILMLSPSFPPSHTVHDSFPSHGVPSENRIIVFT